MADSTRSTEEQLIEVNEAISVIMTKGQEYRTAGGYYLRRADLPALFKERKRLEELIEAEQQGLIGAFNTIFYDRR